MKKIIKEYLPLTCVICATIGVLIIMILGVMYLNKPFREKSEDHPLLYVQTGTFKDKSVEAYNIATYTIDPQTGVITATTIGGTEIISTNYTLIP